MEYRKMEGTVLTEPDDDEIEIDLGALWRDFRRVFRRWWWLVVVLALAAATAFYGYQYMNYEPMYESSATFTVGTGDEDSGSYGFYYSQTTADQLSKSFPYVLESNYFRSVLLDAMDADSLNGTITAETVEGSNVVTMRVRSSRAEDAKAILDAALEVYPEAARFVLGTIQFHMISEAQLPAAPYNILSLRRLLVLGGGAGAAAGLLILIVMAFLRRTVRTPEEMQKITSMKCLAAVPQVRQKARKNRKEERLSVLNKRMPYDFRESIQALQIRADSAMKKNGKKVLMVTSSMAGEGKSTVALNLAEMLASRGNRVLLIDADLRRQEDAKTLGCGDGTGLQDLFSGTRGGRGRIRYLKENGFYFIGSSRPQKNPAGVLSHPGFPEFLEKMKGKMDYIILDTPPCSMFQDAVILAEYADSILYVVKYDFVSRKKLEESLSFLEESRSLFLGYVFSAYPQTAGDYGYGRYGYGKYGYGRYGYSRYGYGRYGSGKEGYERRSRRNAGDEDSREEADILTGEDGGFE